MSFLSRAFIPRQAEARAITSLNGIPKPGEDALVAGWTPEGNAMALSAFYACVTLLADTISSLSVSAYRQVGSARVLVDPQPRLLRDDGPYPGTTWFEWLWMEMESLAVTGQGYGLVTARDPKDDKPTAIMPIHPDVVHVEVPRDVRWPEPVYRIEGERIPNRDMVHVRRYPIAGAVLGMSPIQKAASAVGLALAAERYGLTYFRDSANPSSVLESDLPLNEEQTRRIQQQWVSTHGGRRRPAIMSGGVKWRPIALTPNESQFLETRQFQRSEIAMWFRVPPHMIGDTTKSTSWGTGIEQQSIGFVTYTLRPWLTCIEQVFTALLPRGQFAKFNIDGLLRGDVKARWEAYRLGRDAGVYSVNDIRALEDLPPVDGGEGRIQPMNFVPLGYEPPEDVGPEPSPDMEPDDSGADESVTEEDDDDTDLD